MNYSEVSALVAVVDDVLPSERSHWPPGWLGEVESALLDAVFSARATYGTPTSGVRRVIDNWRTHRNARLDDLAALADLAATPDRLEGILGNRQRVPGNYTTKAEAAAVAAAALVEAGIDSSSRIGDGRGAWEALTTVPGIGTATWETFVLQLGLVGPAALDAVRGFVTDAVDHDGPELTETEALGLLGAAADMLGVSQTTLLNAVWRSRHTRAGAPKSLSA